MRRLLIALSLLSIPMVADAPMDRVYSLKILEVEKHWDAFIHAYFGCPAGDINDTNVCKPTQGRINYEELKRWGAAVDKLRER